MKGIFSFTQQYVIEGLMNGKRIYQRGKGTGYLVDKDKCTMGMTMEKTLKRTTIKSLLSRKLIKLTHCGGWDKWYMVTPKGELLFALSL